LFGATAGLVACGGDDEAAPVECVRIDPVEGVTELTVVGKNLAFDVECFEIEPSRVRFTFVNEDEGVSHNLHVTGEGVNERTDLERGQTTQVLELELTEPGRYDFVCDPHGTMEGSLIVVDPDAPRPTTAT
jgi:plastocyanin